VIKVRAVPVQIRAASSPNRSSVPPCSGQSRPTASSWPPRAYSSISSFMRKLLPSMTDVALGPGMSVVPTVRVDPAPSLYEELRGWL
jgi:hypothetical protein